MKTLVLYDSNFGSTKLIAETIATELFARVVSVDSFTNDDLFDIDLLVVGSPIIGWRPTEKMQKCLKAINKELITNIKITTFDTRVKLFIHGDAMIQMMKTLESKGAEMITIPRAFYVKGKHGVLCDGEIDKARDWALLIKKNNNN